MQSISEAFSRLGERERRKVLDKPLSEIVRLLEFNLLEKFWQTELQRQGVISYSLYGITTPLTMRAKHFPARSFFSDSLLFFSALLPNQRSGGDGTSTNMYW